MRREGLDVGCLSLETHLLAGGNASDNSQHVTLDTSVPSHHRGETGARGVSLGFGEMKRCEAAEEALRARTGASPLGPTESEEGAKQLTH